MKTADEIYADCTYQEAETALRLAGGIAETARIKGKSLDSKERSFVLQAREKATLLGLSVNMQNTIEQEGATIVRRAIG